MGVPRPCPSGYRLSPVRRWRVCGSANAAGVGRGSRSGGTGDSRIAPTTGCDARGRGSCGSAARERRAGEAPFDRLRANGFGKRACGGEEGMRWGTETAPHRAPLDTGFRRYDGGGVRGRRGLLVAGGPSTSSGRNGFGKRACGERAVRRRGCDGGDGDAPRRAPARGSRFRENDDRDMGVGECCWCRAGVWKVAGACRLQTRHERRGGPANRTAPNQPFNWPWALWWALGLRVCFV